MATVKVKSKWAILDLVDSFVDKPTAERLGRAIVTGAKEMIASGQSPVRGYGRFEKYKNPKSYPGDLKPARPVNLNLSGDMLRALTFQMSGKNAVTVSIDARTKEGKIAGYHQDGTPNMAQRKIVPGDGEEWAVSIMRKIRDVYETRLKNIIRQGNK